MKNHQIGIISLRDRIEAEKKASSNRNVFSKSLKREIVVFTHQSKSQSEASRKLGISQATVSRWVRENATKVIPPRKLYIAEAHIEETIVPIVQLVQNFDAVLPNGVILRGLLFNAASLALLRGAL